MRDKVLSKTGDLADFAFDDAVAAVFDDMVNRSVPGYQFLLQMVALAVKTYGQNDSNYYDLGASTGAVSWALGLNNSHSNNQIIAVDNSHSMCQKCEQNLTGKIENFEVICADIIDIEIKNAAIVVLNLTLQFIAENSRQALIDKVYSGLKDGGILLLADKIHFDSYKKQAKIDELHTNFKRANGYSELEIANKRQALENVLQTDNQKTHLKRFDNAGFSHSICHFQCLNFAGFLAFK